MTHGPTARRRQLGRALRKAREDAGLTQSSAARALGSGQGKVNKIETTLVAINMAELDKLIDLYGIPQKKAGELRELVYQDHLNAPRRTHSSPSWSAFEQLRDLELDAREIFCWHSERIPGPLQSEHYMLRQYRSDTVTTPDVVHLMRQRAARARIFTVEDPPHYRVVLSESSLRRMPGDAAPELVIDQVEHLLNLIGRFERLELQILTFQADIPFVDTDFQILRFASDEPDFAYIESPGGARTFDRPQELKRFEEHWFEIRAAALSPADSAEFLEKLVNDSQVAWDAARDVR